MNTNAQAIQLQVNEQGDLVLDREDIRGTGLQAGDQLFLMPHGKNQFFLIKVAIPPSISKTELAKLMQDAFQQSNYNSREKIIELTREVKREMAQEW